MTKTDKISVTKSLISRERHALESKFKKHMNSIYITYMMQKKIYKKIINLKFLLICLLTLSMTMISKNELVKLKTVHASIMIMVTEMVHGLINPLVPLRMGPFDQHIF